MNKLIQERRSFCRLYFAMIIVLMVSNTAISQAKLVIAGAAITISNNATLVIDNPDNTAITYTGAGYIQMQGAGDKVTWRIGAGNGNTYLLPFGNASRYFPMQFNAAGGAGAGQLTLSTYASSTWKNSDFLPAGIPNVNRNGADNSAKVIDRFWQINPAGYTIKPTLSNIVFTYTDQELAAPNSIVENNLIPQRWNSSLLSWSDYFPAAAVNTVNNTVTIASLPGNQLFEWWTLADASFALPVTLVDFTAVPQNKTVLVRWETASEVNTSYFEVYRSKDQQRFDAVGKIAAAGNSPGLLLYTLTDVAPYSGVSYYRLKLVDKDEKFTWSAIVKIVIGNEANISVFPNPADGYINLSVNNSIVAGKPIAKLYDAKGSLLHSFAIIRDNTIINTSLLPAGLYHIYFMYNEKPQTLSFIKK